MDQSESLKLVVFTETRPEKIIEPLKSSDIDFFKIIPQDEHFIIRYIKYFFVGFFKIITQQPDRILTNALGPLSFVAAILGKLTGTPVTIRLGGNFWKVHKYKIKEGIKQKNIKKVVIYSIRLLASKITCWISDSCFVVSENIRKCTIDNTSIKTDNIIKIPVPIDITKYSPKNPPENNPISLPDHYSNIIITVTNLQYYGKLNAIVDILPEMSTIIEEDGDTAYLIAGDGQYLPSLRREIKSVGPVMSDHIYALGYVNNIPDLLRMSDLMVYVSYNDGSPNAVLEAQATAVPVVANDRFGMSEQIVNGRTGFLIDTNNKAELVDICTRLLDSGELRDYIGKNARAEVTKRNSQKNVGDCISMGLKKIHNKSG